MAIDFVRERIEVVREDQELSVEENVLDLFRQAALNGQPNLALTYLVPVVDALIEEVESMQPKTKAKAKSAAKTAATEE